MVSHDIRLEGVRLGEIPAADAGPTLLQRTDQEFLPAVLEQLRDREGRRGLAGDVVPTTGGEARLYQPVHRTFHPVILEAYCERPGRPRLDPARIDSAGLVVRRRPSGGPGLQGWLESGNRLRGWLPLDARVGLGPLTDPDPSRRPDRLASQPPEVRRLLALNRPSPQPFAERVSALFVAAPEVCSAAGRTLIYGLVPVTSSERSEAPAEAAGYTEEQVADHLSPLLRAGSERSSYGWLGRTLRAESLSAGGDFQLLQICLEQLMIELHVFGSFGRPGEGADLLTLLNQIALPYSDRRFRPAGELLERAARVLLARERVGGGGFGEAPDQVRMPSLWPAIDVALRRQIVDRTGEVLERRAASVSPAEGRYADPEGRYEVRAFVRVRRDDGCPPRLVWSAPSHPFTIAPWFESGDAPPVQVALPDATDRNFLRRLKPNVAFAVPENLFNQLRGTSLEKLMNGERGGSGTIGLDWICGFNIPIITVCAFFVLSVFLGLLNFVFFWLPFVKICIPFPRRN